MCGGELLPELEKQSREHMNMIYNTIVKSGLAKEEHIFFVRGRGGPLNSSLKNNFEAWNNFRMYGTRNNAGGGGFFFGPANPPSGVPLPTKRDNGKSEGLPQKVYGTGHIRSH